MLGAVSADVIKYGAGAVIHLGCTPARQTNSVWTERWPVFCPRPRLEGRPAGDESRAREEWPDWIEPAYASQKVGTSQGHVGAEGSGAGVGREGKEGGEGRCAEGKMRVTRVFISQGRILTAKGAFGVWSGVWSMFSL